MEWVSCDFGLEHVSVYEHLVGVGKCVGAKQSTQSVGEV